MPLDEDWTLEIRAMPFVQGYLLIGEGEGGCVGSNETWAEYPGWTRQEIDQFTAFSLGEDGSSIFRFLVATYFSLAVPPGR